MPVEIDRRLFCRSTVGFFADQPSALGGERRQHLRWHRTEYCRERQPVVAVFDHIFFLRLACHNPCACRLTLINKDHSL
jgi:hypothetical protein